MPEQGAESRPDPRGPVRAGLERGARRANGIRRGFAEGREQGVLLALEVRVEGLVGDAGFRRDVGDREAAVATPRDERGDRVEDALAVTEQPPVARGRSAGDRLAARGLRGRGLAHRGLARDVDPRLLVAECPVEQLVDVAGQLVRRAVAQMDVDHATDPADDRADRDVRDPSVGARLVEALAEEALERLGRGVVTPDGLRAGAERLDRHQPCGGRIGDDDIHEGAEAGPESLAPVAVGAVRGRDAGQPQLDDQVLGLQEAVLLVGEVLVEGAPRDAGQVDDGGQRGLRVAVASDRLDHRALDPGPLVTLDLARIDPVGAGRQRMVERLGSLFGALAYAADDTRGGEDAPYATVAGIRMRNSCPKCRRGRLSAAG